MKKLYAIQIGTRCPGIRVVEVEKETDKIFTIDPRRAPDQQIIGYVYVKRTIGKRELGETVFETLAEAVAALAAAYQRDAADLFQRHREMLEVKQALAHCQTFCQVGEDTTIGALKAAFDRQGMLLAGQNPGEALR